jgi:hypothetical protein
MKRRLVIISCLVFACCAVASGMLLGFSVSRFVLFPTPPYLTGCWADTTTFNFIAPLPGASSSGLAYSSSYQVIEYRYILRVLDIRLSGCESHGVRKKSTSQDPLLGNVWTSLPRFYVVVLRVGHTLSR